MKKILFLVLIVDNCYSVESDTRYYNNHTQAVTAIAFDKEGRSIITGSLDGTMCKRGLGQTYEGKTVEGLGPVTHLKRIEKFLAVVHEKCNCAPGTEKHPHPEFYNIDDLTYKSAGALREGGHNQPIVDMQIINGKSMVTADKEGKLVFLYNCMRSVVAHFSHNVNRLTVASPSRIIFSFNKNKNLAYYDPEMDTCKIKLQNSNIDALAALKHYLLAFSTKDNKVMLLNSKTGADIVKNLGEHSCRIVDIKKINKRLFATIGESGTVKIWNAKTGQIECEFTSSEKSKATALAVHWDKKKQEGKIAVGHENGVTIVQKYDLEK